MNDEQHEDIARPERPVLAVLWGVLALVAVAALVGGVLAVGATYATRASGLGGGDGEAVDTTESETLFLPSPSLSPGKPSQYITLSDVPEPELPSSTFSDTPAPPETDITLFASPDEVGQMQNIDLTGSYLGGDGAVLRVQQFEAGRWGDFPVTVSVNGDVFSTFIQASALGENRFRVVDTDTGAASNEVRVTIS